MLNIVTFKWKPLDGQLHHRKQIFFGPDHVNRLQSMLERNIQRPFQLHCITDDAQGISDKVRCLPLWDDYRAMGGCYTRLKLFSEKMKDIIGKDFFSIDLDTIIVKDITELLEETRKHHEFKIWSDTHPRTPYNGSFFYMKAGKRKQVWETFDPRLSPDMRLRHGYVGTDQAWIGVCLGEKEAKWDRKDGIYSYRVHFKQENRYDLNGDERIIFFHGSSDPSKKDTQRQAPWIEQHWR